MILVLAKRHYGLHQDFAEAKVDLDFDKVVSYVEDGVRGPEPVVDEATLLAAMPPGFLRDEPRKTLLVVDDADSRGGTAVGEPKLFRRWGKYFDSYSLFLKREPVTAS